MTLDAKFLIGWLTELDLQVAFQLNVLEPRLTVLQIKLTKDGNVLLREMVSAMKFSLAFLTNRTMKQIQNPTAVCSKFLNDSMPLMIAGHDC